MTPFVAPVMPCRACGAVEHAVLTAATNEQVLIARCAVRWCCVGLQVWGHGWRSTQENPPMRCRGRQGPHSHGCMRHGPIQCTPAHEGLEEEDI
jgi:hypothetical protein